MPEKVARSACPATSCRTQTLTWPFVIHWQIQRTAGWLQRRLSNSPLSQILGGFSKLFFMQNEERTVKETSAKGSIQKGRTRGTGSKAWCSTPLIITLIHQGRFSHSILRDDVVTLASGNSNCTLHVAVNCKGMKKEKLSLSQDVNVFNIVCLTSWCAQTWLDELHRCMMDLMLAVTLWVFSSQAG